MEGDILIEGFGFSGGPTGWKLQGVRTLTIQIAKDKKYL